MEEKKRKQSETSDSDVDEGREVNDQIYSIVWFPFDEKCQRI